MKIKLLLAICATVCAVIFSGCSSVSVAQKTDLNNQALAPAGTSIAHLNAQNSGFYLFSLPLITGGVDEEGTTVFGQDTVSVSKTGNLLTKTSKNIGATKSMDMASQYSCMGFIFYVRSVNMSANAIK